ncbi:MAG: hypothetical protein ACKOB4_02760, partial [Acidobacteriota bacterium]
MMMTLMSRSFLAIFLVGVLSGIVPAQEARPASDPRVGIDATKQVRMTLRETILMALENNREIEIERLNVQMNDLDYRASQGFYDPSLMTSLFYGRRNIPIANPLAGGANGGLLTDNLTGSATISQ